MSISGLSKIEKRLISAASAVAAGCRPCTEATIRRAREVGACEEDILKAVRTGLAIKRQACHEMQQEAQKYLDEINNANYPGELPMHTKTDELIAAGATFSVNSTNGFERHSAAAVQLGATESDIKVVVQIARHVKEQAGLEVKKTASLFMPVDSQEISAAGGCGCNVENNEKAVVGCS